MEARLAKLRIVGLQYDSTEIQTGNLEFDYTVTDDQPGHSAYILRNGGGKGVFLQALFQPLDPLTAWKEEKNTVNHFFFNNEERPVNYTFHVIQEWHIFTEKKVVMGISIAPRLSNRESKSAKSSPIELDYLLYTKELPIGEDYDIFSLPLWDEEEEVSLPLSEWKEILRQESAMLVCTKYQREEYMEKIEEYGFDKNTVSIMKNINVGEGGFGKFFDGSTDNMGLFYNLIIPSINDKVEGIDSRNKEEVSSISTSFLDTLKIAKELPHLLSMMRSIEDINGYIEPLKDRFKEGEYIKQELLFWEEKGIELYYLLRKITAYKSEQLSTIKQDTSEKKELRDRSEWKLQNVGYVELCQEKEKIDGDIFEMDHEVVSLQAEVEKKREEHLEAILDLEVRRRDDLVRESEELERYIEVLTKKDNNSDLTEKMAEIRDFFAKRWEGISNSWQEQMSKHYRTLKAHDTKILDLQTEVEIEVGAYNEIDYQVRKLKEEIEEFQEKLRLANEKYNNKLQYVIHQVLDEKTEELTKTTEAFQEEQGKLNLLNDKLVSHKIDLTEKKKEIERLSDEIEKFKIIQTEIQNREEEVIARASQILKEKVSTDLDRDDFSSIKNMLEKTLLQLRGKQRKLLQQKWDIMHEIDLIEEGEKNNCYIPNYDLLKVKLLLEKHQVESIYGTEYLKTLSTEDAERELTYNPALRYSVIVLEEALDTINFSFIEEELLKNYVVLMDKTKKYKKDGHITTNPSLSQQDAMNYLFKDRSYYMAIDEYEHQLWRTGIENQDTDLDFEIEAINESISKVEKLIRNMDIHLNGLISVEVAEEVHRLKKRETKLKDNLVGCEQAVIKTQEEIKAADNNLKQLEVAVFHAEETVEELRIIQFDIQANEDKVTLISQQRSLLIDKKKQMELLRREKEYYISQRTNNQGSYESWLKYVKKRFQTLKSLLKEIHMPSPDTNEAWNEERDLKAVSYPPFALGKEEHDTLTSYEELERSLANKNQRIAELKVKNANIQEKVTEIEISLQEMSGSGWQDRRVPEFDTMHLQSVVSQKESAVTEIESEISRLKESIRNNKEKQQEVKLKVNEKQEELETEYPDYGAEYVELRDCKEAKEIYRKERNKLRKEYRELQIRISELSKEVDDIDHTLRLLSSIIKPSEPVVSALTEEERIMATTKSMDYYTIWNQQYNQASNSYREYKELLVKAINGIKDKVETSKNVPIAYKTAFVGFLSTIRDLNFEEASNSLDNYLEWAEHNLQDEMEQKRKAEDAIDMWVKRTTKRTLDIVQELQSYEVKLTVKNWVGERFPLIKFSKNYPFPTNAEETTSLVKEFCLNEIDKYVRKYESRVEDLTVRDIVRTVNVSNVMLHVMGEYPKLLIHIPNIDGALLRGSAQGATYKDWETINDGSITNPTKSGGQTLMAQFIVMAMILRQRADENSSLFMVSDNPFGTMSAAELVEATFSLLDLLNIQWLVVAPPITNVQITSKFNTIYNMSIEFNDGVKRLSKRVIKNHRKYLEKKSVLENPDEGNAIS